MLSRAETSRSRMQELIRENEKVTLLNKATFDIQVRALVCASDVVLILLAGECEIAWVYAMA